MVSGILNALGGWSRTSFQTRGLVQGYLPVTSVIFPATATDVASVSTAPTVTAGDIIPIDVDGYVIRIETVGGQTIADATKMQINIARSGYSKIIGSGPTLNGDVSFGTKLLRRVVPNSGTGAGNPLLANGTSFLVAHDNLIHAADTIISVVLKAGFFTGQVADLTIPGTAAVRNDTITYDKPMIRPITPPFRRYTTSATVEFMVVSGWATGGQQVARVEARAKRGGTYGSWAGSNVMVRSASTPTSGRAPSGIALPVYSVDVSLIGLADTVARGDTMIVYRAYGFFGDQIFDSETDGGALQSNGLPTSLSPPAGLPIIKDVAGVHAPIYAWVNRDGSVGGLAAIQTGTTDPGASVSYASEAAAFIAARSYNNTNRGHSTTSGIVILFRDVAGGSLGNSDKAYWQRATMATYSDGLVPPVLSSATYLSTGTTNTNCRRRAYQDDGVTASTSRNCAGVFEFRGITLDGIGAFTNNTLIDGGAGGLSSTVAGATTGIILVDCDIREERTAAGGALYRPGWRWDLRVEQSDCADVLGLGNNVLHYCGTVASTGGYYWSTSFNAASVPWYCLGGTRIDNQLSSDLAGTVIPEIRDCLGVHIRIDCHQPNNALFRMAGNGNNANGRGVSGLMVRKTGTFTGSMIAASPDGVLNTVTNLVIQHASADSGDSGGQDNDRLNWLYGDQAYIQLIKRGMMQYCGWGSVNIKDDTFAAPEFPGGTGYTSGWAASVYYVRGSLRHDNNATPASRIWYQALSNFVSGATQATDFANTARWQNMGAVNGVLFGAQPRRTGNWRAQHAVRCFGNVAARTANNDTAFTVGSWAGEVQWRGGAFYAVDSTVRSKYFKNRTGGLISTLADRGDYRPQSLLAGDANDSPLLNRVPRDLGVEPFDLLGVARRTDGSGAAGPYERSA